VDVVAHLFALVAEHAVLPVSEILPVKGAELGGVFPSASQTYIVIAAGVGAHAKNSVAREFVAYLMAAPNSAVIRDKGMER
jgi:ABC-type molybdate transport system substrate-binding protein